MSLEISVAEAWLYGTLTSDSTLMAAVTGVYFHQVPLSAELPVVLVTYHLGNDVRGIGKAIIASTLEYVVRVLTDQGSFASVAAAADQIQTLLHAVRGEALGGTVISCTRVRPFLMIEETDNRTEGAVAIRHLGGIYQVMAQGG